MGDDKLLQLALESLSNIFKLSVEELKAKLIAWNVANWTAEPFTRGSYSYDTVDAPSARKLLNQPVENTLFFAGEYLYDGPAMGTVEAALTSGLNVAERMLG
jgi:monoamine oxidase